MAKHKQVPRKIEVDLPNISLQLDSTLINSVNLLKDAGEYQLGGFKERLGVVIEHASETYTKNNITKKSLDILSAELVEPECNLGNLYKAVITELYTRLTQNQITSLFTEVHESILARPDLSFLIHEPLEQYIEWELPAAETAVRVMREIENRRGRKQVVVQVPALGIFYPPLTDGLKRTLGVVEVDADEITGNQAGVTKRVGDAKRLLTKHKFSKLYTSPQEDIDLLKALHAFSTQNAFDIVVIDNSSKDVSEAQFYVGRNAEKLLATSPVNLSLENEFRLPEDTNSEEPMIFLLNPALKKTGRGGRFQRASIDDRNLLTKEEGVFVFDESGAITTLHRMFIQKFGDKVEERIR